MIPSRSLLLFFSQCLIAASLLAGCETNAPEDELFVRRPAASVAYLTYFGPAPAEDHGAYQALVGFLPRVDAPAKISPFPVFQPNKQDSLLRLLQRLISADVDLTRRYDLINPFPQGTRIQSLHLDNGLLSVDLSRHVLRQTNTALRRAMVLAIGHAAVQFPGVRRVLVIVEGIPLSGPRGEVFRPDPLDIVVPGPPHIVGVSGLWGEGANTPHAITIFFDRPIHVQEMFLTDDQGRLLDGTFTSTAFDMAQVLHPASKLQISSGMRVRVVWQVIDTLGEEGSGEHVYHLQREERP